MKTDFFVSLNKSYLPTFVFDFFALLLAYFLPAISHLTGIPFYYAEPMRLIIILALIHTRPLNVFLLAASLPLFSSAVSAHPVFLKSLIMSVELIINVGLFYFLVKKSGKILLAAFLSITISKFFYYLVKYFLISMTWLDGSLFSTPLIVQLITLSVFSALLFFFFKPVRNVE